MIEKELRNAKICNTFKEQLETYKFKCTQKLESECLNIVDQWVNSKIQFIPSTERSEEFKLKFTETIETYFEGNTAEICDFKLIMDKWTINFESDDDVFFQRTKNFVSSLLRIREIDQFLRGLKLFFANCSKKFYNLLLDVYQQSLLAE